MEAQKAFDTFHLYFFNDDAKSIFGLSKTKQIDHLFDQERKDGAVALFFDAFLQEASLNLFFLRPETINCFPHIRWLGM